ncbi:Tkp3 protein [Vanderwaltozyma polyspora DSM 70294]|uniref:Tkp3 protein n=1 Tax=Vanderwaltozyma polyspora (strain ATCC 22028 / DSM 70294 / BCRC 21397 / CBS 2163 / NBRC 10782 / NRRL Y-8283 / UCD 57-17) TaxID=436907 RepID=A7TTM2_VANPO|nr:Tkp3 protein [Vanderwaltozyma polyspora DSM 70294]EDO14384.1 Tkp3 protein [Vanderwaltozyma polyspora DSM 70294]
MVSEISMTNIEVVSTKEDCLDNLEGYFNAVNTLMREIRSLLEQLTGMLKIQVYREEIRGKILKQASIQFSALQRNEEEMASHIVKDEEDIAKLGETEKNFAKRFNVDESELKRFEDSVEKRLFQMEEKMNSKDTNISGSKFPSLHEILARVGKHFPHLIIYGSHGLLTNCNKNYSDVSLSITNDTTLKEEHLEDPARTIMNIQDLLTGEHIRFQDLRNFLYSCSQDDTCSYLTDLRGLIVD